MRRLKSIFISTLAIYYLVFGIPSGAVIAADNSADNAFTEIEWDALVPENYRPEAIMEKYQDRVANISDNSAIAALLYKEIQAELDSAPVNEDINRKAVKIPGFIAPLDSDNGQVSEFLLVPYFGACIHVPPPPLNQTVHVKTAADSKIDPEEVFLPIWVYGEISTESKNTDIGNAGYSIKDARIELYLPPEATY